MNWARESAVEVHSREAARFADWYADSDPFSDVFVYGRHRVEPFFRRQLDRLAPQAKVLDAGCGTGEQLSQLLEEGRDAVGLEPASGMLEYARARCPGRVELGSVLELPFEDNSFDLVYALEVLRYLDSADNDRALGEIQRVLKPGGVFFGTFVNRYALDFYFLFVQWQRLSGRLTNHVEFETPRSVTQRLASAGFQETRVHGAMFAFLRVLQKLGCWKRAARLLMPFDAKVSDLGPLKPLAGHLIGIGRKPEY